MAVIRKTSLQASVYLHIPNETTNNQPAMTGLGLLIHSTIIKNTSAKVLPDHKNTSTKVFLAHKNTSAKVLHA